MHDYEVELQWIGKRKMPSYILTEYGFKYNPPITIRAKSMADAKKQLILSKYIRIKNIKEVV